MRARIALVTLFAPLVSTAACTSLLGDFSVAGGAGDDTLADSGGDGTLGDGSGGGDGSPITDGASGDGSTLADGGVKCGYPGEACCTGPFAPCNDGTKCVANECKLSDVWAVGEYVPGIFANNIGASIHYDGTAWTKGPELKLAPSSAESNPYPTSLWSSGVDQYKAVTRAGFVMPYQGGSSPRWRTCSSTDAPCSYPSTTQSLWSIYGFDAADFWLAGTNAMFHCSNVSCVSTITGLPATWGQGTFAGTSSHDLWYPQFSQVFHYDGTTWTVTTGIQARAMWAHAPNDVWAGDTKLQHFDGTTWSSLYEVDWPDGGGIGNIFSISGTATDDVWAAGYRNYSDGSNHPFTIHWDGTAWKLVPIADTAGSVTFVWAGARDEAFVIGSDTIYKWEGTSWNPMTLPPASAYPDASFGPPSWEFLVGSAKPRP